MNPAGATICLMVKPGPFRHWKLRALFLLAASTPLPANAAALYTELGVGASMMLNGGVFTPAAPAPLNIGAAFTLNILTTIFDDRSIVDLHVGVVTKMSNGTSSTGTVYTLLAPYPALRVQIWRFYLGWGATPFVFPRTGTGYGFDNMSIGPLSFNMIGEFGFLFPIAPNCSIGLEIDYQAINMAFWPPAELGA
jgi:hypothetical protein